MVTEGDASARLTFNLVQGNLAIQVPINLLAVNIDATCESLCILCTLIIHITLYREDRLLPVIVLTSLKF